MYEVTPAHLEGRQAGVQISLAARNMVDAVKHVDKGLKFIKRVTNQSYVGKYILYILGIRKKPAVHASGCGFKYPCRQHISEAKPTETITAYLASSD